MNALQRSPQDTTVLITGGTGSFGKTMVRHLLKRDYGQIRIFSRDEWKQEDMRVTLADPRLSFHIGDVRDITSVNQAMDGVNLVFHAAALKQVPSCEFFPMQAVETNVTGSSNVIESAISNEVDCCVCLGTDKAVYPVNSMGMTKALMEKVAQSAARRLGNDSPTKICSVRYGNVMYSRGSVIPLFIGQIKNNKPITVTDSQMTRFMLPLRDSVDLVEFAFSHAQQGDIFIKKAASCTIDNLVKALTDLFKSDVEVRLIGTRHGEKLHEVLASAEELRRSEDMGDYFRVKMDQRNLDYSKYFTKGDVQLDPSSEFASNTVELLSVEQVQELLLSLPEVSSELEQWNNRE